MIRIGLVVWGIQQLMLVVGLFLLWSVKDGTGIVELPNSTLQAASTVLGGGLVLGFLGQVFLSRALLRGRGVEQPAPTRETP
ncbi:hypothetical protein MPTA5024_20465 [Microbispora sp. ATCC PTA-5024]|nr:hypothetical protein MPTA5024_20465 [Microbispora sp. ATCC PTA-5024]